MDLQNAAPSVWQARGQRREVAKARDTKIFENRFDRIDSAVAILGVKVDNLLVHVSQLQKSPFSPDVDSEQSMVQKVSEKVERLEMLLLRTSMADFEALDAEISKMMPICLPTSKVLLHADKVLRELSIQSVEDEGPHAFSKYEEYEIFSNDGADVDAASSSSPCAGQGDITYTPVKTKVHRIEQSATNGRDDFQDIDALFDEYRDRVLQLRCEFAEAEKHSLAYDCANIYERFADLIIEGLQDDIREALQQPQTRLSRMGFGKLYAPLQEQDIWRDMCLNFCEDDLDPLTKSDAFIKITWTAYKLWTGKSTKESVDIKL